MYKRKAVNVPRSHPLPSDINIKVWYIPFTREWFTTYQAYLDRMDFYNQKKFVCEVTGNSCLTYLEAYNSELKEISTVEKNFPENLKEPVLRYLQFSTVTRIDQLVDEVYLTFRNDYYPGETVYVRLMEYKTEYKVPCVIKEKAKFNSVRTATGVRPSFCQYRVQRLDNAGELVVDENLVSRDRNTYSKWFVKTFIKMTVSKSPRIGAPWVVKDKFAAKYNIPTEYPYELIHFKEEKDNRKRQKSKPTQASLLTTASPTTEPKNLKSIKPKERVKLQEAVVSPPPQPIQLPPISHIQAQAHIPIPLQSHSNYQSQENVHMHMDIQSKILPQPQIQLHSQPQIQLESQHQIQLQSQPQIQLQSQPEVNLYSQPPKELHLQAQPQPLLSNKKTKSTTRTQSPANITPAATATTPVISSPASVPAPSRKIEEDLERPFKFFQNPSKHKPKPKSLDLHGSVELALECWTFLNVYRVPLMIDSFTFDDFITAINWDSPTENCSLLNEIFCCVLSAFMNENSKQLCVPIPEDLDDEEEEEEEKEEKEGDKGKEEGKDSTKEEDDPQVLDDSDEDDDDEEETNRVDDYLDYRDISWKNRLSTRNFKDGDWQIVLLGILDIISDVKEFRPTIRQVFDTLAPIDSQCSQVAILNQFYKELSVELRLKVLNMLCSLLMDSQLVRQHMEKCLEGSTQLRRERLEKLKEFKTAFEAAQQADKELRELMGNTATETVEEQVKKRRRNFNRLAREPTEQELKFSENNETSKRLLETRSTQLKVAEKFRIEKRDIEQKLIELDIQRIKYLGKDRYYNKYWWFECNGLPSYGGRRSNDGAEEDDEGADDEYENTIDDKFLMGRLWIQGPDEEDCQILGLDKKQIEKWRESDGELKTKAETVFKIKVEPEESTDLSAINKKLLEETDPLFSSDDWRFYDSYEELDKLTNWLDNWGVREHKLLRELENVKEQIKNSFKSRRKALKLDTEDFDRENDDTSPTAAEDEIPTSQRKLRAGKSRKSNEVKQNPQYSRCSEWVNNAAIEQLGHTHYEGNGIKLSPPKKSAKSKRKR